MDSRAQASATGGEDYTFDGQGGMSWTIPYVAGLYALVAQLHPELRPDQFRAAITLTARSVPWPPEQATALFGPVVDPGALKVVIGQLASSDDRAAAPGRR
jgi:subtilisin family serine protease